MLSVRAAFWLLLARLQDTRVDGPNKNKQLALATKSVRKNNHELLLPGTYSPRRQAGEARASRAVKAHQVAGEPRRLLRARESPFLHVQAKDMSKKWMHAPDRTFTHSHSPKGSRRSSR